MSPKVSVLIPVYNAEKYLEQCLSSLSAQTFTDFEIICLDDGSRDSSAKVLRAVGQSERRLRFIEQANAGVAAARNRLLAKARGKIFVRILRFRCLGQIVAASSGVLFKTQILGEMEGKRLGVVFLKKRQEAQNAEALRDVVQCEMRPFCVRFLFPRKIK